jgi:hypothetical protein
MADWRRPALGTARPKPAIQDVALNVSKVASKSSAGAPALGHNRPLVIRSEFPLLARFGWLIYGCQLELRFGSSRPRAVDHQRALSGSLTPLRALVDHSRPARAL